VEWKSLFKFLLLVWPAIEDPKHWTLDLTVTDISELESAYDKVTKDQIPANLLLKDNFVLPSLGQNWKNSSRTNPWKRVCSIRKLPVDKYSESKAGTIFYGIGLHLG